MEGGPGAAGSAAQLRLRWSGAARRRRLRHEIGKVTTVRVRDEKEVVRRRRRSGRREQLDTGGARLVRGEGGIDGGVGVDSKRWGFSWS